MIDDRLLEPGWAGELDEDQLAFIRSKLKASKSLSFRWGFRPGQKTRSDAAIRRIAMYGDPDYRALNMALARPGGARKAEFLRRQSRLPIGRI